MLWERLVVANYERLVLSRDGQFDRLLVPGEYRIGVLPFQSLEAERHDTRKLVFRSVWADYLIDERPELAERHFTRVETSETEVAMVYVNGELFRVLAPVKRLLFWRGMANIEAEIVTVIADASDTLERKAAWAGG
jgi:hypothetical protein